ncbi:hypothetical protein [Micromonospora eburnea]|uniref:hypothetical protein n=1 Tax=Micromonospora eburnea TaxID=227316 RepID=UPI00114CB192|nr:hypothetical protein [Micromonospora eburnea]
MIAPLLASRSWRLRAAVAAAVVLVSCLAVPVGWAAIETVEADRGEATPVAAANAFLLAVFNGSDDELGIRRCLCDDRESELLTEVRAWRTKVAAAKSEIKVESSDWKALDSDGIVSATIAFRFAQVDEITGGVTFISGSRHEWRFHAKRERGIGGGWKVCRVDAPPLCGTHVRC